MIGDASLRFDIEGQDPFPLNNASGAFTPFGGVAAPRVKDLQTYMDLGNGTPLYARFTIRQTFASSDAGLLLKWAVFIANSTDLTVHPLVLVESTQFVLGALSLTSTGFCPPFTLPLPPLSRIHVTGNTDPQTILAGPKDVVAGTAGAVNTNLMGRRYIALGAIITTSLGSLLNPFTAGRVEAKLFTQSPSEVEHRPVGFGTVAGQL